MTGNALLTERPAPLFAQQQSVLRSLVDEWDDMTADERRRTLAAIFDTVAIAPSGMAIGLVA